MFPFDNVITVRINTGLLSVGLPWNFNRNANILTPIHQYTNCHRHHLTRYCRMLCQMDTVATSHRGLSFEMQWPTSVLWGCWWLGTATRSLAQYWWSYMSLRAMMLAYWRQHLSCTVRPMPRPKLNLVYFVKSWNYLTLMIITNEHTSCDWMIFWQIISRIGFTDYGSGMVSWEQQDNAGVETTIDWLSDMHLKHKQNLL